VYSGLSNASLPYLFQRISGNFPNRELFSTGSLRLKLVQFNALNLSAIQGMPLAIDQLSLTFFVGH